jgi:hypothetical protein
MPNQTVDELRQRARRYALLAFILGILGFVIAIAAPPLFGFRPSWTSWALPLLVSANSGVMLVPRAHQHPRGIAIYYRLSMAAALIITAGVIFQLVQRAGS